MRLWPRLRATHIAVIRGSYSGSVHPVPFVRFFSEQAGQRWCAEMNERSDSDMSRWELEKIVR